MKTNTKKILGVAVVGSIAYFIYNSVSAKAKDSGQGSLGGTDDLLGQQGFDTDDLLGQQGFDIDPNSTPSQVTVTPITPEDPPIIPDEDNDKGNGSEDTTYVAPDGEVTPIVQPDLVNNLIEGAIWGASAFAVEKGLSKLYEKVKLREKPIKTKPSTGSKASKLLGKVLIVGHVLDRSFTSFDEYGADYLEPRYNEKGEVVGSTFASTIKATYATGVTASLGVLGDLFGLGTGLIYRPETNAELQKGTTTGWFATERELYSLGKDVVTKPLTALADISGVSAISNTLSKTSTPAITTPGSSAQIFMTSLNTPIIPVTKVSSSSSSKKSGSSATSPAKSNLPAGGVSKSNDWSAGASSVPKVSVSTTAKTSSIAQASSINKTFNNYKFY